MNIAPQVLYADLIERDFTLRQDGGRLLVRPAAALTDADRVNIAANKTELLRIVHGGELARAEADCWSLWWDKRSRFGDTSEADSREEARSASDACLAAHARYMALLGETA